MSTRPAPRLNTPRAIGALMLGASAGGMATLLCWYAPTIAAAWRAF